MKIYYSMPDKEVIRLILERVPKDSYEYDVVRARLIKWIGERGLRVGCYRENI